MSGNRELRDAMTANYEDVRRLFDSMRDADVAATTQQGWPVWRLAGHIVLAPLRDVRVARRLAAGKRATPPLFVRLIEGIEDWRRTRAFSKATRAGLLAAWENAFNELFSCVNDIGEEAPEPSPAVPARGRRAALEYLTRCVPRAAERAATLGWAIGAPVPAG